MRSFAGATEWLNSESLGPAELRGHVVLVNFWAWTCINWLRDRFHARDAQSAATWALKAPSFTQIGLLPAVLPGSRDRWGASWGAN